MKRTFLAVAILASALATLPQPGYAQAIPAGSVNFNAEDRLAVINLISSYGPYYDENRLDLSEKLYWEDAEIVGFIPEKNIASASEFFEWARPRRAKLKEKGIEMRHYLIPKIIRQTETAVAGIAYFQKYWIADGEALLNEMGVYKFEATKKVDEWRLSRWEGERDFASE